MTCRIQVLIADTVKFRGHNGDKGEAYYARPTAPGKVPGVVLIHHMPGWDEWITEATRKLAHHGFATISPHLYFREGPGSPDDVGARVRAAGGVADDQVVGDAQGAAAYLRAQPNANGKVGVIGFCSGGRHAFLIAARRRVTSTRWSIAGAATWWWTIPRRSTPSVRSRRLISPTTSSARILGLFGNDDENPNKDQVNRTEAVLKKLGKNYSSTATTAPATRSSMPRASPTAPSRPPTAGRRCSTSFTSISAEARRHRMCSYIVEKARLVGTAKGPNSRWMRVDTANVYYDHPYEAQLDHALCVDFVCEADGGRERVAIEISRESALELIERIKAALASGDASHANAAACSLQGSQADVAALF